MIRRYRTLGIRTAEAVEFEGGAAAAAGISRAFGGIIAYDDLALQVRTRAGIVFAGPGSWIVRDVESRDVEVLSEREFRARFESATTREPASPWGRPMHTRSFDVV